MKKRNLKVDAIFAWVFVILIFLAFAYSTFMLTTLFLDASKDGFNGKIGYIILYSGITLLTLLFISSELKRLIKTTRMMVDKAKYVEYLIGINDELRIKINDRAHATVNRTFQIILVVWAFVTLFINPSISVTLWALVGLNALATEAMKKSLRERYGYEK